VVDRELDEQARRESCDAAAATGPWRGHVDEILAMPIEAA